MTEVQERGPHGVPKFSQYSLHNGVLLVRSFCSYHVCLLIFLRLCRANLHVAENRALLIDPALWLIVFASVCLIYHANSRTKTAKRSTASPSVIATVSEGDARDTLSPWKILIFPVIGSAVLVVLFFWLKKIFWLLTGLIAFSSFSSVSYVLYPVWFKLLESAPYSYRYRTFALPVRLGRWLGISILPTAVPLSAAVSLGVIVLWLCTSSWFVTNLIAACLALTGIVSIPLSAGKIATLLLAIFWVYDIFWVFISPLIFPKNVMETVAVGVAQLQLPLVLKIPRFASFASATSGQLTPHITSSVAYFQQLFNRSAALEFLMLGLGDIILPGLALNFFYRRDELIARQQEELQQRLSSENEEEGENEEILDSPLPPINESSPLTLTYYMAAQVGYALGMVLTFIMLILLKRGQPALLYLVPCTLLPPFILAWRRKQLSWLWNSLSDSEVATVDADASEVGESRENDEGSFMGPNSEEMSEIANNTDEREFLDHERPSRRRNSSTEHYTHDIELIR